MAFFSGLDSNSNSGLWETDGTAAGTFEIAGIAGVADTGIDPSDITYLNNEVLFAGVDQNHAIGLWATNGTAAGTIKLIGTEAGPSTQFIPRTLQFSIVERLRSRLITLEQLMTSG